jgi:predicted transcriptional regulator of viral defense system
MERTADISGHLSAAQLAAAGVGAFFRPNDLEAAGVSRYQLRSLVRRAEVERVGRGLYRLASAEPTENYSIALVCARVPTSVVCLLSALRIHELGSQAPRSVWIAVPHKARVPRVPEVRVRVVRFSGLAWTVGVKATTFEGVHGRITTPARTVVDCFRFERLVGPEVAMEALVDALDRRLATRSELSRIERELPSRRLRAALDLRSL